MATSISLSDLSSYVGPTSNNKDKLKVGSIQLAGPNTGPTAGTSIQLAGPVMGPTAGPVMGPTAGPVMAPTKPTVTNKPIDSLGTYSSSPTIQLTSPGNTNVSNSPAQSITVGPANPPNFDPAPFVGPTKPPDWEKPIDSLGTYSSSEPLTLSTMDSSTTNQPTGTGHKYKDEHGGWQLTGIDPNDIPSNHVWVDPNTIDSSPNTTEAITNTDIPTADMVLAPASSGLTLDDLNSWWDTKQGSTDKFDQFKEFMGLMSGMGGMFGGGGVPGFASGGVAAASPYNNFMGFMNAFKALGGGGDSVPAITTGNQNL